MYIIKFGFIQTKSCRPPFLFHPFHQTRVLGAQINTGQRTSETWSMLENINVFSVNAF